MVTRRQVMAAGVAAVAIKAMPAAAAASGDKARALADAASGCVRAGEACLQHCLELLAKGDTSIADCAKAVTQMLAVCRAVGPIADARSRHLAAMAQLCQAVCGDCAEACRKHAEHHTVCKACLDACEETVAAAKAVAA
ncbi:MAG: Csp1 family four helix bundle copper storage protein [Candidatus Binatia bacterium]